MTILNADKWLKSVLTGDATLTGILAGRVYSEAAPQGTAYPLATISMIGTSQVSATAQVDRIMDEEDWQVTLATDGQYLSLETAADRIRALLHKATGTGVLACEYMGSARLAETRAGIEYRSIVMEFRIYTQ